MQRSSVRHAAKRLRIVPLLAVVGFIGGSQASAPVVPDVATTGVSVASKVTGEKSVPVPRIDELLPENLPTGTAAHLPGYVAVPLHDETPGYATTKDSKPTIMLSSETDTVIELLPARWTVVDMKGDWVEVLVPVGRRALPSENKAKVNHAAAWVHKSDVRLAPSNWQIDIDTKNHKMTVHRNGEVYASFSVGNGIAKTPTPKGLCSVIGHVYTTHDGPQLLTSCQSEAMDSWQGYPWAATGIHYSLDHGRDIGKAISNGCVRVGVDNFDKYLKDIPVGTPIIIT